SALPDVQQCGARQSRDESLRQIYWRVLMPLQPHPYVPPAPGPLVMAHLTCIDTSTTRPGVRHQLMYWCDVFMPLDHHNLRTLYDIGSTLYTASSTTIVFFYFVNISSTPYAIVFLSNGSVVAVNTLTSVASTILPVGTITNSSQTTVGISQW